MNIKTEIFTLSSAILIAAVLIIIFSVLYTLNWTVKQQAESLYDNLRTQSYERLVSGNSILQNYIANYILETKNEVANVCSDEIIKNGIALGQWKAIDAHLENISQKADIDFIVIFDEKGRLQNSWPGQIGTTHPEAFFKESNLFKGFQKYIQNEDLVNVPVISSFKKWSRQAHKEYNIDIDDDANIVLVFGGIIPNDYYDEPIGYCLVGINSSRLSVPFMAFSKATGQFSLIADGGNPIVWAGLSGGKKDIKTFLQSLSMRPQQIKSGTSSNFEDKEHSVEGEYHIHAMSLADFSGSANTTVATSTETAIIINGEPESLVSEAGQKIKHQGKRTIGNVIKTTLLIVLIVLILSMVIVNLVGNKITKPISLAAEMSDKIASGDLEYVMDESGADETTRLARSMNIMAMSLKELRVKNTRQLKSIEEGKRRSESILSAIHEGVMVIDAETHKIVEINPAAAAMINVEHDEIIGDKCHRYLCSDENINCPITDKGKSVYHSEGMLLTKDGSPLSVLRTVIPITLEGRECLLESFTDISRLKQAEEESKQLQMQLQRAQKMESIGTLAGGVAHDLNNVLSGILSYPELLLMDLPQGSPLRKPILTIKKTGERAAAIVQDLLTMARRGVAVQEVADLNIIISEYLKSPEHKKLVSFHPGVNVKTNLEAKLFNIVGSSIHLTKTVMNLVSNAAEAMPDGGELLISTKNRYIDMPIGKYEKVEEGEYVVLSVYDNGMGIAANDLDKIFEPFYTKKMMGRSGTGLGMAVVWGTIRDHNGYIDAQSIEGEGTTFTLYFPVSRKKIGKDKALLSIEDYKGNKESVLVVDDSEEQREIASAMLQKLNYSVVSVASGEKAIRYLKDNSVDLLLLDMIMEPGIDGLDTYKQILETHPKQKAIVASGFSETDRVKEIQRLGAKKYIKKPYTFENIGLAIKDELGK